MTQNNNNNNNSSKQQQEQQQEQENDMEEEEEGVDDDSKDISLYAEDLFSLPKHHIDAIEKEFQTTGGDLQTHIEQFVQQNVENVERILNGQPLKHPKGLFYNARGEVIISGYRPFTGNQYHHDWFVPAPYRPPQQNQHQQNKNQAATPTTTTQNRQQQRQQASVPYNNDNSSSSSSSNSKTKRITLQDPIDSSSPKELRRARWVAHRYVLDNYRYFLLIRGKMSPKQHIALMNMLLNAMPHVCRFVLIDYNRVLNTCRYLKARDFPELPHTGYQIILASYIMNQMLKYEITPDTVTFNTLLALYVDIKGDDIISKLLYLMSKLGVKIDLITYTSLLDFLAFNPQKAKVEQVYRDMRASFPTIDQQAYVSAISAAVKAKHFDLIHEITQSMNREIPTLNTKACNSMIVACSEEGQFDIAESIFEDRFIKQGRLIEVSTVNCMLKLYQKANSPKLLELFNNMEKVYGVKPDDHTMGIMMLYYLQQGDYGKVEETYRTAVASCGPFNEVLNNLMARGYAEKGDLQKMSGLFDSLRKKRGAISNNFLQYYFRTFNIGGQPLKALDMYLDPVAEKEILPLLDDRFCGFLLSYIMDMNCGFETKMQYISALFEKFERSNSRSYLPYKRFMYVFLTVGDFNNACKAYKKIAPGYRPTIDDPFGISLFSLLQCFADGIPTTAGFTMKRYLTITKDYSVFVEDFHNTMERLFALNTSN